MGPPAAAEKGGPAAAVVVSFRGLAFGGAAVGDVVGGDPSAVGMRAFVRYAAPGDTALVGPTVRKARYLEGELVSVESASPERTRPSCVHFGTCGGCELQHISYDAQLRHKGEMISGAFTAAGLGPAVAGRTGPVRPGPPYHYRRRVGLHRSVCGEVGFYRRGTGRVVPLAECPIAESRVEAVALALPDALKVLGRAQASASVERAPRGDGGPIGVAVGLTDEPAPGVTDALISDLLRVADVARVTVAGRTVAEKRRGPADAPAEDEGSLGAFSQVNAVVNAALVSEVVGRVSAAANGAGGGRLVHDLYAGAGNFSLPLARAGFVVTAVEASERLARAGREAAARAGLSAEFRAESVERFLSRPGAGEGAALVVADPPRSGLGDLAGRLPYTGRLWLVSCHLAAGVRDVAKLVAAGWRVERVDPFDMFPQTSYVEIVTELVR